MLGGKRLEFVEEPSNGDSSFAGLDNYIRTTLKLAGYTIHTYIIRSDKSAQRHYPKVKYTTIYMIYIHTYIQYIRTFINKPTSIHKYINIHTHIHAWILTYIHTYRYVATVRDGFSGTDVTLILDLSQSYDLSTPGWLIQLVYTYIHIFSVCRYV